jgi:hypothetical protein
MHELRRIEHVHHGRALFVTDHRTTEWNFSELGHGEFELFG